MVFVITKRTPVVFEGEQRAVTLYKWSLHRQVKGEPVEKVAVSPFEWRSERQVRAEINLAKRAMLGVKLAKTQTAYEEDS